MPRYYCDYCDTYLTHDSPSVRKQHNAGYKHKANVRSYYQQFEEQQTQSLIDQRIKEHLGQAAAFQVGGVYNQHLMGRPRLPFMPPPMMPGQVPMNSQMGIRPPVFPRPPGAPGGYMTGPMMPQMMAPPGASLPGQMNGLPRPPTLMPPTTMPPTTVTGSTGPPTSSNGAQTMAMHAPYQSNPTAPSGGGFENFNANAQSSEVNN